MTYKDINNFATCKDDLSGAEVVMDVAETVKEINSDVEAEYQQVKNSRKTALKEDLTQVAKRRTIELDEYIEK